MSPDDSGAPEYSVSIGADLIAEALAAVEKREEESRAARFTEEEDDDDVDVVFEDGGDADDDESDHLDGMTVDLGDLDALLLADSNEGDTELSRTRNALAEAHEALEAAELALRDTEAERDEALASQKKARRAAKKYKSALEREVEQRQRLGSTQQILRERLSRADARIEESEQERATLAERARELADDVERGQRSIQRLKQREAESTAAAAQKAVEKTCKHLLPVLDNLELALAHAGDNPQQVVEGVRMVASQFATALGKVGLLRVPASPGTPFDPRVHEAMQMVPSSDQPENTIVAELQAGFTREGHLLRAARVIVAQPSKASAPAGDSTAAEKTESTGDHTAATADGFPSHASDSLEQEDARPAGSMEAAPPANASDSSSTESLPSEQTVPEVESVPDPT